VTGTGSERMRISVVIPTHNRPAGTLEALGSVLAQTALPQEVVVVDDGSAPPLILPGEMAGNPLVRRVRLESNRGAAAARNAGIAAAKGDWIAFLDSDDLWMPDKLERQTAFARERGGGPLACHATGFARSDNVRGAGNEVLVPANARDAADFASGCWFAPGSTSLVPKTAFARVGPFDEQLGRLEDFDWFLRLGLAGGSVNVAPFAGS